MISKLKHIQCPFHLTLTFSPLQHYNHLYLSKYKDQHTQLDIICSAFQSLIEFFRYYMAINIHCSMCGTQNQFEHIVIENKNLIMFQKLNIHFCLFHTHLVYPHSWYTDTPTHTHICTQPEQISQGGEEMNTFFVTKITVYTIIIVCSNICYS